MANLDDILKAAYSGKADDRKTLTKEEEVELGTIIQSSDTSDSEKQAAIDRLVLKNVFLVLKIVHKYKRKEFDFEDLVSYGILGLFKAAAKYDPTRKNRFASYARHWIKESVMKAVREYSGRPKIPVYLVKNLWNVSRVLSQNDTIDNTILAQQANVSVEDAAYLRSLLFKFVQFDNAYSEIDPHTPEEEFIQREREQMIIAQLKQCLTPEQFTVLAYSCELCGYPKMTFAKIEEVFHIKNSRRIKADAMRELKKSEALQVLYKEGLDA
jgi:RNA polymerase sigma factor (sigma-70 family)